MIRVPCSIAGGLAGLVYAVIGIIGAYYDPALTGPMWRKVLEIVVIAFFTIPLGATVGLGVGMILEGFVGLFRSK